MSINKSIMFVSLRGRKGWPVVAPNVPEKKQIKELLCIQTGLDKSLRGFDSNA